MARSHGTAALRSYGILLAFVILVVVVFWGNPAFLSQNNVFNMLSQWAPAGIMAAGMTYVILKGGFDLSVASGYSLCAVTAAALGQHVDPALAFLGAIAVGFTIGLLNAMLVVGVNINPFITTVGTGFILGGITFVVTGNAAHIVDNLDFGTVGAERWHGFPYSGMLLLAFFLVGGLVLAKTVYGEAVYAVGGNLEASRLSGIRVRIVVGSTYVLSGMCMESDRSASRLSSTAIHEPASAGIIWKPFEVNAMSRSGRCAAVPTPAWSSCSTRSTKASTSCARP